MSVAITEQYVHDHFHLFAQHNSPAFFQRVSPTVHWQVMGSMAISGDYHSLEEFKAKAFSRVVARLDGRMAFNITRVIVSGREAAVEMPVDTDSVRQKNGQPLPNVHLWLVKYDDAGVIVDVRMYMDGVLMQQLLDNNPGP